MISNRNSHIRYNDDDDAAAAADDDDDDAGPSWPLCGCSPEKSFRCDVNQFNRPNKVFHPQALNVWSPRINCDLHAWTDL